MPYLVLFLTLPLLTYWRSYVIVVLWSWFVYPAFGVQSPPVALVGGVMLALHLALPWLPSSDKETTWERVGNLIFHAVINPAFFLGFGWLWKWWFGL